MMNNKTVRIKLYITKKPLHLRFIYDQLKSLLKNNPSGMKNTIGLDVLQFVY